MSSRGRWRSTRAWPPDCACTTTAHVSAVATAAARGRPPPASTRTSVTDRGPWSSAGPAPTFGSRAVPAPQRTSGSPESPESCSLNRSRSARVGVPAVLCVLAEGQNVRYYAECVPTLVQRRCVLLGRRQGVPPANGLVRGQWPSTALCATSQLVLEPAVARPGWRHHGRWGEITPAARVLRLWGRQRSGSRTRLGCPAGRILLVGGSDARTVPGEVTRAARVACLRDRHWSCSRARLGHRCGVIPLAGGRHPWAVAGEVVSPGAVRRGWRHHRHRGENAGATRVPYPRGRYRSHSFTRSGYGCKRIALGAGLDARGVHGDVVASVPLPLRCDGSEDRCWLPAVR